jgi:hypothetical protein
MAALDFPASPTNGQVYGNWTWNATKGAWQSLPMTGPKTITADVPPLSPQDGDQWFNTVDGTLYVWVVDVDGGQWVESRAPIVANGYYSPNYIINGAFDIWQRGTSFTTTSNVYLADRWYGEGGNVTVSRQTTGVPASSTYCMRTAMTATTYNNKYQLIESVNVAPMRGKTVTFQAKLRRNASFSGGLVLRIYKSSTIDAGMNAGNWVEIGGVNVANSSLPTATGSTNWYLASVSAAVPNDGTASSIRIEISQTVAEVSGAYWELAEVQLEAGTTATGFRRNQPNIQAELAACQRYYIKAGNGCAGIMNNPSTSRFSIIFPVTMRTSPSFSIIENPRIINPTVTESQTSTNWATSVATGGQSTPQSVSKFEITGFTSGADGRAVTLLNDCVEFRAEL